MGTFRPAAITQRNFTAQELNDIALNKRGIVGGRASQFETNDHVQDQHGYGFRWINTKGTGNHGQLVLTGKSDKARKCLYWGTVNYVKELAASLNVDISSETAKAVAHAARACRYGREEQVLTYVLSNITATMAWKDANKSCDSRIKRTKWTEDWKMPINEGISMPRWVTIVGMSRYVLGYESLR